MSSTSRSRVRVSSALFALVAALALGAGSPARAATPAPHLPAAAHAHGKTAPKTHGPGIPEFWFSGAKLIFDHAQMHAGEIAVGSDDPGFGRLLTKTGCTLSYDPSQKYVLIATPDRRNIAFTIGDAHYMVGDVGQVGPFAPYKTGDAAYLPLSSLIDALHIALVTSLDQTILQPQLAGIDVESRPLATVVTLHSATPLRFKRISDPSDAKLTLALLGVGTALPSDRPVSGVGLAGISIAKGGTPRNPTVVLSFDNSSGGSYVLAPAKSQNDLVIAFAPEGTTLGGTLVPASGDARDASSPLVVHAERTNVPPAPPVPASPGPEATPTEEPTDGPNQSGIMVAPPATNAPPGIDGLPTPAAAVTPAGNVLVTSIDYSAGNLGFTVAVGLSGGPVSYEFHRLPDNRWYVDLKNVALAAPARDENVESDAVSSLRVKQLDAEGTPVTRVALSLATPRIVTLKPTPGGFAIVVDSLDDLAPKIAGAGVIGSGVVTAGAAAATALVPQAGSDAGSASGSGAPWKFGPSVNGGGRLIVIDPGHGGSDDGASHNGLREKDLTLDMARRLRTLLVAHGWQVKMTRDSDVDVFGVNASAHDELQARCDVANNANAHLFISIHVNSFTSSDLNGTTTYWYTNGSLALAQAVHRRLVSAGLQTKDDGIIKNNFYVIHHTTMPSILVETAFVSNAADADLLRTPAWRQRMATGIAAGVGDYDAANPASAALNDASDGP